MRSGPLSRVFFCETFGNPHTEKGLIGDAFAQRQLLCSDDLARFESQCDGLLGGQSPSERRRDVDGYFLETLRIGGRVVSGPVIGGVAIRLESGSLCLSFHLFPRGAKESVFSMSRHCQA